MTSLLAPIVLTFSVQQHLSEIIVKSAPRILFTAARNYITHCRIVQRFPFPAQSKPYTVDNDWSLLFESLHWLHPHNRDVSRDESLAETASSQHTTQTTNTAQNHKQIIVEEWQRIDRDKPLCKKLMKSIPKRFDAVRRLRGRQIRKENCEHE